uniref:NR LBD domain-containing protein n=1 Tax=Acrobeloides nanus TaxID=290746 RepID=A0A914E4E6_9BILA
NWIGRIDDPSMMLSNSEQFPLLNAMFLIMRQALSWREHLLEYPSEPFGTSNAPRYYSYSLHRKVVMTEYIVMKQVVDAFYAFKEFSAEAKQTIVMNSYNYWLPFHMCLKTALYGDGSVKKIYTHRIMHFDVDMDSLINLVKSDKEKFSAPESDCQISARHLHKFLTGNVPMLVSALRYMKLNDYEMAAVYLLILIETNKSVAPMDTHAQHTLNHIREQLLKELYEFYEDDDKWRLGEILLLLCSIMETGNDFLESITLMDVCKRKIVYFALRNNNEE